MRQIKITLLSVLLFSIAAPADAYRVTFKEQFYRLFHRQLVEAPNNIMENIFWLEMALRADFANPLHALARIETETEWEKYKNLFNMHLNLKMVEQYLLLGNMWNKRRAYFFNAPWRRQNLESLDIAENLFRTALYYWEAAKYWAERANDRRFRFINLERVQFWEDSARRIETGRLNYERTINRHLASLQRVREAFLAMPE